MISLKAKVTATAPIPSRRRARAAIAAALSVLTFLFAAPASSQESSSSLPPPPPPPPPPGWTDPEAAPAPPPGYVQQPPPDPSLTHSPSAGKYPAGDQSVEAMEWRLEQAKEARRRAEEAGDQATADRMTQQIRELEAELYKPIPRYSTGMFVTGIVFTGVGGASILASFGLAIAASRGSSREKEAFKVGAIACLLGGGTLLALGIPLMNQGGKSAHTSTTSVELRPSLLLSPQGFALRAVF